MLISETHLTTKNSFEIPGYNFYDTKHPEGKACGGTGILIKSKIKHYRLREFSEIYLQSTPICILDNLTVAAIYCPPKFALTEQQFTNFFKTLGTTFLAAGDFNCKHTLWGSRLISPRGKKLYDAIKSWGLDIISNGKPTYWPTDNRKLPDLIDFGIVRNIKPNLIKVDSSYELSSDHSPTILTVKLPHDPCSINGLNLTNKNTNWNSYRKFISTHLQTRIPLKSSNDIDLALMNLMTIIKTAAISATSVNNKLIAKHKSPDDLIDKLVAEKRQIRRLWQTHKSPSYKRLLNESTKNLKKVLRKKEDQQLQSFLSNLDPTERTDYSLWKATKNFKLPVLSDPPIRLNNGHWAKSDTEKGEAFVHHLKKVFTPNESTSPEIREVTIPSKKISRPLKFKLKSVIFVIKKEINTKKAPGADQITPKMIFELPIIAIKMLLHIFNAILRTGYYPTDWKTSQITMIPKPGKDNTKAESYRPVSLLPIIKNI